jgi:hypothetical protein
MSWSALLISALLAIALAAAIIISVQNWSRLAPALARWGWLGTLLLAVLHLWMAYDGWIRGEATRTAAFGIGTILFLTFGIVEYRRSFRQSGN